MFFIFYMLCKVYFASIILYLLLTTILILVAILAPFRLLYLPHFFRFLLDTWLRWLRCQVKYLSSLWVQSLVLVPIAVRKGKTWLMRYPQDMDSGMRAAYPCDSNKELSLEFLEGYWVRQKAHISWNIVSIATHMSTE